MYSARRCPQAASSLCGVGVRRSFSDGEVMAHPPYGSAQKERIRFALYCVAVILHRFLCQGTVGFKARKDRSSGKGDAAYPSIQILNERTARISRERNSSRLSSSMPK